MKHLKSMAGVLPALGVSLAVAAAESGSTTTAPTAEERLEEIMVIGLRENRTSRGALVLPVSVFDTPQSVSIVNEDFIDEFGLNSVNQVLRQVTGVNVQASETELTYYNARGFDIKSMQVDGIGLPFNWNVVGALDTYLYDKVEVIRGANGLLTGIGGPSGTINYVRKRPTNERTATAAISGGSWDTYRFEGDISSPLTASGSWAGRLLGAAESGDSYLDLYQHERGIVSGLLEGQLGDRTVLTLGYTQQTSEPTGVMWGALPMLYTTGEQIEYQDSTSTAMEWTQWSTEIRTPFAELVYALSPDWSLRSTLTYNDYHEKAKLFYAYGTIEPETGLGLYGNPDSFRSSQDRYLFDNTLTGNVDAFGRTHELLLGVSYSKANVKYDSHPAPFDDPGWGALPPFPGWNGREVPEPVWEASQPDSDTDTDFGRIFGVAHINATDELKFIAGFNAIDMQSSGESYGESQDTDDTEISPYVGVTYLVVDNINLYASFSDIYEPQPELDENLHLLGPAKGESYEAGIKAELLDRRLLASLAVFQARQDNYADYAGYNEEVGLSYYKGIDIESNGIELEVAGSISENWMLQAGFTSLLDLEDVHSGDNARTFIPRQTFNLGTSYSIAALPGLQIGTLYRWQDDTHVTSEYGVICSDAYGVVDAYVSYAFLDRYEVRLNGYNLSDEKYLATLDRDQAYYAQPLNWSATFTARF